MGYAFLDPDPKLRAVPLLGLDDVTMTCASGAADPRAQPKMRGVNLGGWLVLEPWITPSLFYQFLGDRWGSDAAKHVGIDMWSFCSALGPIEGNVQLRRHWRSWVREQDIAALASTHIDTLRIPVGDWMWKPYGPYSGCTDGSLDELNRVIALASKYGLGVLIDIHAVAGSQNGFDSSGLASGTVWRSSPGPDGKTVASFSHWASRTADWPGTYDPVSKTYPQISVERLDWLLDVVRLATEQLRSSKAVVGIELLNEPWEHVPLDLLKRVYWEGYKVVLRRAAHWKLVVHDSFRGPEHWGDFMRGCANTLMDVHIYRAWERHHFEDSLFASTCAFGWAVSGHEERGRAVVVGEWSLATDNCAMWLNGFNDNIVGFPKVHCAWTPCPEPYMGSGQPGAPPDKTLGLRGPFGSVRGSGPDHGMCPVGKAWRHDDHAMRQFATKQLSVWLKGHGWFFWNFRTELEPRWDYLRAVERGWLPADARAEPPEMVSACLSYDQRGAMLRSLVAFTLVPLLVLAIAVCCRGLCLRGTLDSRAKAPALAPDSSESETESQSGRGSHSQVPAADRQASASNDDRARRSSD